MGTSLHVVRLATTLLPNAFAHLPRDSRAHVIMLVQSCKGAKGGAWVMWIVLREQIIYLSNA